MLRFDQVYEVGVEQASRLFHTWFFHRGENSSSMKSELHSLKLSIVPMDQVRLHERVDPQRVERLVETIKQRGILKNPVLVAEDEGRYIVLDGATRVTALGKIGSPHIVVQIVHYQSPFVELDIWHHAVVGIETEELQNAILALSDLQSASLAFEDLISRIDRRKTLFGLITPDGKCTAFNSTKDLTEQMEQLNKMVDCYIEKAEVHRTINLVLPDLKNQYPGLSALILFPHFTPYEVIYCAHNQSKLPAGISRHKVNGRALGLNVPLDILTGPQSIEEKNEWLNEMVSRRRQMNRVRIYAEPTLVFDE